MTTTAAWQVLLQENLKDFLYFFIPKLARVIDYEQATVFFNAPSHVLNQSPERAQHNLLLGLRDKDEQAILLLLTLEYGGYDNRAFEQQLFRDLTATLEEISYKIPVASFVLFLANSIPASMNGYEYDTFDTQISMSQPNYAVREQYFDDLWELKNPMTFAVASSRVAIETSEHPNLRLAKKQELLQRLLTRFQKQQITQAALLQLLRFITHILPLTDTYEAQFQATLINTLYEQTTIGTEDKHLIIQAMSR